MRGLRTALRYAGRIVEDLLIGIDVTVAALLGTRPVHHQIIRVAAALGEIWRRTPMTSHRPRRSINERNHP